MPEPKIKMFTVERLHGPSLRETADDELRAEGAALIHFGSTNRRYRRARRRQDRLNAIAWHALRGVIETGDQEYVDCREGQTRIRLAEDDMGDMLAPRNRTDGWYEAIRWWKPLHWAAWWRTYRTKQIVMVESA